VVLGSYIKNRMTRLSLSFMINTCSLLLTAESFSPSLVAEDPKEKMVVPPVQLRSYLFSKVEDVSYKSLKDLKVDYMEVRKQSFEQVFQFLPQAQMIAGSKVQLHITRDPEDNTLNLVVTSENNVS